MNEYDYKKMMDNFELEARHNKILKDIKDKWSSLSALHDEKVQNMKILTEKMYKKKDRELKKKLSRKEEIIKKQLEMRRNMREEEKKKREAITKKKVDDVFKNLIEFKNVEEEKRLILERETFDKCNNKNFLVNRIEKNYNENRQKIYKKLVNKNVTERDNYITSLNKYLKEQEAITETKKEKAFKKYQGYVRK